ncbi:hypothetical protein OTK49_01310 [Vibrio coralliirubri]|uniref:hypothetical protein n=1 Tax=Vibrio coralliirubri TaxID=1516159 RepID=UPI00228518BC|nr:hypothetical protein [Vibrio coralliirubri]MCY9861167.1 hypothetical protein [Vibrio coralliirubri]
MNQDLTAKKRIPLTVSVYADGMVTIDDKERVHVAYGNIDGMYKSGSTQGVTLSLNSTDEAANAEVMELCNEIAAGCYKLQNLLTDIEKR